MRILVYGAGPAGLNCAYWASREGHKVKLYERRDELAKKPCGEAIPREALLFTPFKEGDFICNEIKRCLFYADWRLIREVKGVTSGYIIDKKSFLRELMEEAMAEGAEITLGKAPAPENFDLLVDATGNPGSFARAYFDYSNYKSTFALQCYCKSPNKLPEDAINLFILPYGYAWIFPKEELYNVGVGGFAGFSSMKKDLKELLIRFNMRPIGRIRTGAFSIGGPLPSIQKGRVVVVGEAAGMVMPFTGEGIRYALYSGSICFKPDYQRRWEEKYGKKLKRGRRWLERIISLPAWVREKIIEEAPIGLLLSLFQGEGPRGRDLVHLLSSIVNLDKHP